MPYLILLIGISLFIYNILSWHRIKSITLREPFKPGSWPLFTYIKRLGMEWWHYAMGDGSLQGMKGGIFSLIVFFTAIFLNAYLHVFSARLTIPCLIIVLFIAQIRIGRIRHRRYFENRFPEVLSIISSTISAGSSIHQALNRCGKNIGGDLGPLFRRIDRRLNLGEEPERVFKEAWQRYRYREFYFFAVVMMVTMHHGGQIRALISRLSRTINSSKTIERRKAAMTSEARMSVKIVAAIPVLFFLGMKYLNPENFDFIINDPVGRLILYYVIISEAIGILTIWVMLKRAT